MGGIYSNLISLFDLLILFYEAIFFFYNSIKPIVLDYYVELEVLIGVWYHKLCPLSQILNFLQHYLKCYLYINKGLSFESLADKIVLLS